MANPQKTFLITLPFECIGERIDAVLAKQLPDYSRMQIKQWIEADQVLINDKPVKSKLKVKGGEIVAITTIEREYTAWEAEEITLPIFYEDDALIIINKPVGMVVHPGAGNKEHTLLNALLHHDPALHNLPRAGILHRIDKNTSGLLIIARTQQALVSLSRQLKSKTLVREYQTIVTGKLISGGKVSAPIARHPRERKRMSVQDDGKPAVTHYRVMEKYAGHTRLRVQLETGRTHQIRVHMAHIRHPIVGDPIYGGRFQIMKNMPESLVAYLRQFKRQALHAFALEFIHPVTNETVRFETPLPDDMLQLIELLKA